MQNENLVKLRKEVVLNSLFTKDFENSFGIPAKECQDFFDSYFEWLWDAMEDDGIERDCDRCDALEEYDNDENLIEYYNMFDEDFDFLKKYLKND